MKQKFEIGVLSDIHGNRWALEAVLKDIRRKNIREIVNLGDSLYGPLDPAGTADLLLKQDVYSILGNQDRILLSASDEGNQSLSLTDTLSVLKPIHIDWLKKQPFAAVYQDVFYLCHGSPERDTEYLVEEIRESGTTLRTSDRLQAKLSGIKEKVILCGHSHVPRTVCLPDGRLILNPGSVGLPAYSDDYPYPHVMEVGTPHARYTVLCRKGDDWQFEQVAVPYDWEKASRTAEENGRLDWARWLLTGRA